MWASNPQASWMITRPGSGARPRSGRARYPVNPSVFRMVSVAMAIVPLPVDGPHPGFRVSLAGGGVARERGREARHLVGGQRQVRRRQVLVQVRPLGGAG